MGGELNIVGCGRSGQTLARLFTDNHVFEVKGVLTRSMETARAATSFIGAGSPLADLHQFAAAPVWMIATPDDAIIEVSEQLVSANLIRQGDIVFHLSGALCSNDLAGCREAGASVASVHPIQNMADPALSVGQFAGTWCAVEGTSEATMVLKPALEAIGGRLISIAPHQKTLYHAGAVMACNYLVALLDVSLDILNTAGIHREQAAALLEPILRTTVDNVLAHGAENAITGPISRGDVEIIERHLAELEISSPESVPVYKELGRAVLAVVERRDELSDEKVDRVREALEPSRET